MSASSNLAPGTVIGRYTLDKTLGAGGMGVVISARHRDLDRQVAIKFMLREVAEDPANAERFAREARSVAQLESEHVGRVLDVGEHEGAPFIVMEFLEGQDLDDLLHTQGHLPHAVAVRHILQACEAVAEAHALGIVHRDLKPKNMFLTKTRAGRTCVKVLDFGLAKVPTKQGLDASLTESHSVFGSPQYMSPEQMKATKHVDGRTDIWALGVTLYQLVTGELPFAGTTVLAVCASVIKDTPKTPSTIIHDVPPALDQVILKCLEKEVEQRYQTVDELIEALTALQLRADSARKVSSPRIAEEPEYADDVPTELNTAPRLADTAPIPTRRRGTPNVDPPALAPAPVEDTLTLKGPAAPVAVTAFEDGPTAVMNGGSDVRTTQSRWPMIALFSVGVGVLGVGLLTAGIVRARRPAQDETTATSAALIGAMAVPSAGVSSPSAMTGASLPPTWNTVAAPPSASARPTQRSPGIDTPQRPTGAPGAHVTTSPARPTATTPVTPPSGMMRAM